MRVALHSILREGHEAAYDADHAAIPDDLVVSFERVGIHDWQIWRSGRDLFHLVECDDFAAAMRALDDDPANRRWQASINRHVDHFVTGGPGPEGMVLPLVWTLTAQRAAA
ncbi:MAG: L-rhamnose mutarotase [Leifsonia sp.]